MAYRQIGGYMPLLLPQRGEYYHGENILAVNCGRAAIYYALKMMKPKKVYFPIYSCDSVDQPAKRLGIDRGYYSMGEDFLPQDVEPGEGEALLWVNYYGVLPKKTVKEVERRFGSRLIMDNTHAFFQAPSPEAYSVYSCRKFFPVADGGYLAAKGAEKIKAEPDTSFQKMAHRLECVDLGWEEAYPRFVDNELSLAQNYAGMSRLTRYMMASFDYEEVKRQRAENYRLLYNRLGDRCKMEIDGESDTAMAFPMMVKNAGLVVEKLKERGIIATNWWGHVKKNAAEGSFEYRLSDELVWLPTDQRYGLEDMEYMARQVMEIID